MTRRHNAEEPSFTTSYFIIHHVIQNYIEEEVYIHAFLIPVVGGIIATWTGERAPGTHRKERCVGPHPV
jgi:hypothetical protein